MRDSIRFVAAMATMMWASAVHADTCPTAKNGRDGFTVERTGSSQTEVFHLEDGKTRSVGRFAGGALLEVTHHAGLVQLERIDRGKRTVYRPQGDLKRLDAPTLNQKYSVVMDVDGAQASAARQRIELKVVGRDKLGIGPCTYDVLKFEERFATGDAPLGGQPGTFYWSPELKFILARGSTRQGSSEQIIKFDRIAKLKP